MRKRALIVGHGAVGAVFAAALAEAQFDVYAWSPSTGSVAATSSRLIRTEDLSWEYSFSRVQSVAIAEPYDVVVLSVKTTALCHVADAVWSSISEHTTLISAMNGVPWWFAAEANCDAKLKAIPRTNVVGCVINLAATRVDDHEVQICGGRELVFGDIVTSSDRAVRLVALLANRWLRCRRVSDIRLELWRKLLNNASVNPVSALCLANCAEATGDIGTRKVIYHLMQEVINVGRACGVDVDVDITERINWSASYGTFKTSMLQDLEGKRALEVDALLSSVLEIAERFRVPTPYLSCITALVALRSKLNLLNT